MESSPRRLFLIGSDKTYILSHSLSLSFSNNISRLVVSNQIKLKSSNKNTLICFFFNRMIRNEMKLKTKNKYLNMISGYFIRLHILRLNRLLFSLSFLNLIFSQFQYLIKQY